MKLYKKQLKSILVFFITGIIFFALTYFSNTVLSAYSVSSVRPSAAMNPVLGIAFGWPAIIACAVANCISDFLSGYGLFIGLVGIISQIFYGAFPYYAWRYFVHSKSEITRLDTPNKVIRFAIIMAIDSALIGLAVGGFQYYATQNQFWETAWFAFLNDFDMCMIFGLPLMSILDFVYSKYLHERKRRLSFNEVIILASSVIQVIAFVFITTWMNISSNGVSLKDLWKPIFLYSGRVINCLLVISLPTMYITNLVQKKKNGLRVFEKPTGTIFVNEKKRLEFISYANKDLSYHVKSDSLGFSPDNTPKKTIPSYEDAWHTRLSCQKGCPMKCTFCDCPAYGFYGNVSIDDFRYQMETILDNTGTNKTKYFEVDVARMGEPTLNPAVLNYLEFHLKDQIRSKVNADVIYPVLSTMMPKVAQNLEEYLLRFCRIKNEQYDGNASLQISINTTDESNRKKTFKNLALTIDRISEIASKLPAPKGRKYALNFAVTKDSLIDVSMIDRLFDKSKFIIKLTPIHETFNALDNGFEVTTEYTSYDVYQAIEDQFLALGWDVMVYLDSKDEDNDGITDGNLLLSNIANKRSTFSTHKKIVGLSVAIEMDAIFKMYPQCKQLSAPDGFKLFYVEKDHYVMYILQTGMGEVAAASGVQYLISKCNVSMIINFGVVGGLTSSMKKLKVCLVNRVVHYKYDCSEFMDLIIGQVDGHDSIYLRPNENLVKNASMMFDSLSLVTCCSGDKFISTIEEKTYLHETFDGDICDMESAGIVLTCEANRVPCILLKAVSDGLADGAEGFYAELQNASLKCLEVADQLLDKITTLAD